MTDHQFTVLVAHLRVLIVLLGLIVGILIAFAWGYVP